MEQLKQMLEAYRKGERPMPTYAELAALITETEKEVVVGFAFSYGDIFHIFKGREAAAAAASRHNGVVVPVYKKVSEAA